MSTFTTTLLGGAGSAAGIEVPEQRRAVVSIEQAKSLDTRQRRIDKTVGELR